MPHRLLADSRGWPLCALDKKPCCVFDGVSWKMHTGDWQEIDWRHHPCPTRLIGRSPKPPRRRAMPSGTPSDPRCRDPLWSLPRKLDITSKSNHAAWSFPFCPLGQTPVSSVIHPVHHSRRAALSTAPVSCNKNRHPRLLRTCPTTTRTSKSSLGLCLPPCT